MAKYIGPMYLSGLGPYAEPRGDGIPRDDALDELKALEKKANALLCSLYKLPLHFFCPDVNLLESSEVVLDDRRKWEVFVHAEGFKPDEITIEERDGKLLVKGDHPERADEHGFVERSFARTYFLPKEVDAAEIVSRLTPEGILTIEATKHEHLPERLEARAIPIQHAHHIPPRKV